MDMRRREPPDRETALEFGHVSFSYPPPDADGADGRADGPRVLDDASLSIPQGAFCLLVGATGSGKTTLLRLAKPEIAPVGTIAGRVRVFGHETAALAGDPLLSAASVGYVFQSPDNQIVCDTVWHEMAFGLEGLGVAQDEMRRRIAETGYFLGIDRWFRRMTDELSGGQRQVVALAATLVMRPRLLLLDEPTSMLDPVAAKNFLGLLFRVNRELDVTVVVATHAPEVMADYATMALALGEGGRAGTVAPCELDALRTARSLPREPPRDDGGNQPVAVRLSDVWFRYARGEGWVCRGCSLAVGAHEVRALVGANGSGKSTLLSLVAQMARPQRGNVRVGHELAMSQALLPQGPKALLARETVAGELLEWSGSAGYDGAAAQGLLSELLGAPADALWQRHPYDLSTGQQQLVALAKLLITHPRLLLLDEPTTGLDHAARAAVARAVAAARDAGATVIIATHDLAFCHAVADSVSLLFDGDIATTEPIGTFFENSWIWHG
ncbi:ABC transporter ATP-binding protein [Olsenella profusa]|uniref:ABC transporter, ATP-binding protein n=1 Tax=Olsenella profusa F0195 TaxID=1125712 RepID=U2TJ60_9ACTN|nr:ATP-binding cassette domain-containing protein [Olsenella profusa]ERL06238.1 ABC transporter, ATP-binding protein [Olsenella profusa F0195]